MTTYSSGERVYLPYKDQGGVVLCRQPNTDSYLVRFDDDRERDMGADEMQEAHGE